MAGLMDLAANATPDTKPPPTIFFLFDLEKSAQREIYNRDCAGTEMTKLTIWHLNCN
jgi:hypothetical protein